MQSLTFDSAVFTVVNFAKGAVRLTPGEENFLTEQLSESRFSDEKAALVLWVISRSLRHSARPTWRCRSREIWDRVVTTIHWIETVDEPTPKQRDKRWFEPRLGAYQECIDSTAATASVDELDRSVGATFAALCGAGSDPALAAHGAQLHQSAVVRMFELTSCLELSDHPADAGAA